MKITTHKDYFIISIHYRDDNLRLRCNNLVKAGLMRREGRITNGNITYVLKDTLKCKPTRDSA